MFLFSLNVKHFIHMLKKKRVLIVIENIHIRFMFSITIRRRYTLASIYGWLEYVLFNQLENDDIT